MESERLQLMVNQNLNFLLNLASDWAVQLNMELSRGVDPTTRDASDTIRRRSSAASRSSSRTARQSSPLAPGRVRSLPPPADGAARQKVPSRPPRAVASSAPYPDSGFSPNPTVSSPNRLNPKFRIDSGFLEPMGEKCGKIRV